MPKSKMPVFGFPRALPWSRHGRNELVVLITGSVGLGVGELICGRPGKRT